MSEWDTILGPCSTRRGAFWLSTQCCAHRHKSSCTNTRVCSLAHTQWEVVFPMRSGKVLLCRNRCLGKPSGTFPPNLPVCRISHGAVCWQNFNPYNRELWEKKSVKRIFRIIVAHTPTYAHASSHTHTHTPCYTKLCLCVQRRPCKSLRHMRKSSGKPFGRCNFRSLIFTVSESLMMLSKVSRGLSSPR